MRNTLYPVSNGGVFVAGFSVLSGTPPANAFDVLKAKAPTTSDFSRWRIYCAPHNSKHLNGMASLNISTLIRMTYAEIILP